MSNNNGKYLLQLFDDITKGRRTLEHLFDGDKGALNLFYERPYLQTLKRILAERYAQKYCQNPRFVSNDQPVFIRPGMDIYEGSDNFTAYVELPGIKANDIKIRLHGDKLTISGKRPGPQLSGKSAGYPAQELRYGTFCRSFNLPEGVQRNDLTEVMSCGMLILSWPRGPYRPIRSHMKPKQTALQQLYDIVTSDEKQFSVTRGVLICNLFISGQEDLVLQLGNRNELSLETLQLLLAEDYAKEYVSRFRCKKPNEVVTLRPKMDLLKGIETTIAHLELPGVEPTNVEVQLYDHEIVVCGRREAPQVIEPCANIQYGVKELSYREFKRDIGLVNHLLEPSDISAVLSDGILTLSWPTRRSHR